MSKEKEKEKEVIYVTCPFCQEDDFDLPGLKYHFEMGYCGIYNNIKDNENHS